MTELPAFVAGGRADVRGMLVAVHFRDERGFAIFSIQQSDRSRVRALGHLPEEVSLNAVVRVGGVWAEHPEYGWQVRANTVELVDAADRSGMVAFLVAYTKHLGPVRAAEAVALFGDGVFEVLNDHSERLCAIKGITPTRARAIGESFAHVAGVADVDSWLRQIGLGKADARRVRDKYGAEATRLVRENPYRLADDVSGIGFLTADSLRRRLGIAPTSPFRLHAALKYVLTVVARSEGHVYLPLAELVDHAARQLDERRATSGRWEPSVELIEALRTYAPRFAASRDAVADVEFGDAIGEQTPVYGRDLYNAETFVGERLARLVVAHDPLLERTELEQALRQSEEQRKLVLEADQRRAVAVAKAPAEDGGAHAQRIVVESAARLGAQVLTPQHASAVGVAALNRVLQARLNPAAPSKPEVEVSSELIFRLGDRVIVGKNNYKTLCFNGETGEIVDISPEALELRLEDAQGERRVVYDRDDWWQLQLAYAVTNHRAQGSEWPNVIVVVSQSHYLMLQRNLVYTALTRARKRAVIVVSGGLTNKRTGAIFRSALEVAVAKDEIDRTYSGLTERLERAVAVLGSSASSGDSTVHSGTAVSRG